jgi:hypothetical protein
MPGRNDEPTQHQASQITRLKLGSIRMFQVNWDKVNAWINLQRHSAFDHEIGRITKDSGLLMLLPIHKELSM